jgi:flavodoxin
MTMNIEVRYFSRSGQTKKVAEAIARAVGVSAKDCATSLPAEVDLLFLGGAMYWGGIDKRLKTFVAQLTPATVKRIVVFSTSSIKAESAEDLETLARERGIAVSGRSFHCWGEFALLHKNHPDDKDLKEAADFAFREASSV